MPSTNYAYVNGKFVPDHKAVVSIADRGFLYGDGCFETLRVYDGRIFRWNEHLARLFAGLNALGIEASLSPAELRAACRALVQFNDVRNGVARIYQSRDSIVITVQPREFPARELYAIVSTVRLDGRLSQFKTANRLPYILAQREAERAEVNDAVLLNAAGRVVEFTASNLFLVKNDTLLTPPLVDGPLPGITRELVLTMAAAAKLPARELSFGPELLATADEVFATNSLMEIAPVLTWGRPGKFTRRLQTLYRQAVSEELGL
ncbi:MAG: aminotransferase class IV [Verrucomicrobiota bacterium]|jgi:branched-chain amino acid aminotransferase